MAESTPGSGAEPSWAHHSAPSTVSVEGIAVAYRRGGRGERVLYLHSDGFTRTWLPFFAALSESVEVIAPEHPGYGSTPNDDRIQSFDDLVLHYDAFLRELGLENVHLVGHGLGGWLAADLAITYPTRFASVTLITPAGLRLIEVPSIDTFRQSPEERRTRQFNGRAEHYLDLLEQEGEVEDAIRAIVESAVTGRLAWNPRYDVRLEHRLARVARPTLVLSAEDDRWVPTPTAQRFANLIPEAELRIVPGDGNGPSGHLLHIEQPATVAQAVVDHVRAHSGGAA